MTKELYVHIPYKYVKTNPIDTELMYIIMKNKTFDNTTTVNVDWLIGQSLIVDDKRNENRKYIQDFFNLKDYRSLKTLHTDFYYQYNQNKRKIHYVKIYLKEHDKINDLKLFNYYCFLVHMIDLKQSYSINTISEVLNYSNKTIVLYNQRLHEKGLLEWYSIDYDIEKRSRNIYSLPYRNLLKHQ